MAVITHLTRSAVESLLQEFGVGRLLQLTPVALGIENTNYFVKATTRQDEDTDSSEYVLTVIEDDRLQQRELMFQVLDTCFKCGLPVAPAMRTTGNAHLVEFREKAIMLSTRLKGRHVTAPASDQCRAIGRFLSRMHHATDRLDAQKFRYLRDEEWITSTAESVIDQLAPGEKVLLQTSVQSVRELLSLRDVQALPKGVIHGDLFRDNALFNEYGLTGIVDFHHASYGFKLFDIAVAINDWCRKGDVLDQGRTIALLNAYNEIRPLQPQEYWFFSSFLLYAALAFWLSRLHVAVQEELPEGLPAKDPSEFRRVVQRHLTHPFRLHKFALAG